MDGSSVTWDLLQGFVGAGVPDGDSPIFTPRNQQSPCCIQTNRVHLESNVSCIESTTYVMWHKYCLSDS